MSLRSSKHITLAAMIAGLYAAICIVLAPISFGAIQIRLSEALTLLAVFSPVMGVGITVGCGISNFIGFMMGVNPMPLDIIIGTAATGIAAYLSWLFRNWRVGNYPFFSALPPIIVNAIIIGGEITFLETGALLLFPKLLAFNMLYVAAGQLIPCLILGPQLVMLLERNQVFAKYL